MENLDLYFHFISIYWAPFFRDWCIFLMEERLDVWMNEWMNGWWMDGRMRDGWVGWWKQPGGGGRFLRDSRRLVDTSCPPHILSSLLSATLSLSRSPLPSFHVLHHNGDLVLCAPSCSSCWLCVHVCLCVVVFGIVSWKWKKVKKVGQWGPDSGGCVVDTTKRGFTPRQTAASFTSDSNCDCCSCKSSYHSTGEVWRWTARPLGHRRSAWTHLIGRVSKNVIGISTHICGLHAKAYYTQLTVQWGKNVMQTGAD